MFQPDASSGLDGRIRADAAAIADEVRTAISSPATVAGAGARGFSALMIEVGSEVQSFIASGSSSSSAASGSAGALSAEAAVLRARLQAAPVTGEATAAAATATGGADAATQQAFLDATASAAAEAGRRLGVAPAILQAQAALESGWGQRPLRGADGSDSHNLFGIKAGESWRGEAVAAATTEYEGGRAQSRVERFRSYASAGESFGDLATMLGGSARYQAALNTGSDARAYARALTQGGYATDPRYADKLVQLAARIGARD